MEKNEISVKKEEGEERSHSKKRKASEEEVDDKPQQKLKIRKGVQELGKDISRTGNGGEGSDSTCSNVQPVVPNVVIQESLSNDPVNVELPGMSASGASSERPSRDGNNRSEETGTEQSGEARSCSSEHQTHLDYKNFGPIGIKRKSLEAYIGGNSNGVVALRHITSVAETCHLGDQDAPVLNKDIIISEPISHSVFIVVHKISNMNLFGCEEAQRMRSSFQCCLRLCPEARLHKELFATLLTVCDPQLLIREYGSVDVARIFTNEAAETMKAAYDIQYENPPVVKSKTHFTRDSLLLPLWKVIHHGIPNPITRPRNLIVNHISNLGTNSRMFALDSESVQQPTRVALVNESLKTDYDKFINIPGRHDEKKRLSDRFDDFTEQKFEDRVTIPVARTEIGTYVSPNHIIVGLNIFSDLNAFEIMHPYISELQDLYSLSGDRQTTHGLHTLAEACLWFERPDHYPSMDSYVTMKLIIQKLSAGPLYKNEFLKSRSRNILSQGMGCIVGPQSMGSTYRDVESFFVDKRSTNIQFFEAATNSNAISVACEHLQKSMTVVHLVETVSRTGLDKYVDDIWNSSSGATAIYVVIPTKFIERGRVYIGVKQANDEEKEQNREKKEVLDKERKRLDSRTVLEVCKDNLRQQCLTS